MDNILNNYRIKLEEETKYKIPLFEPPPKDLKEDFRYLKDKVKKQ